MRIGSNGFLGASLVVLSFAFFFSIFVSTGMFYGESYHIVVVLEADPQAYTGYVEGTVFSGVLPIAASLALFIIACLKGRETPTDSLRNWLLIILGGLCVFWGSLYFHASYVSYSDAIVAARGFDIINIDGSVLAIYTTYGLVAILWLTAGLLFIIMSAHKLLQVKKSLN